MKKRSMSRSLALILALCLFGACGDGVEKKAPECTPGEKKCVNGKATVCSTAEKWESTNCASDEQCEGGLCKKTLCVSGETICEGGKLNTCKSDGSGWKGAVDCPAGEECVTNEKTCKAKSKVCSGNQQRECVSGTSYKVCKADGSGWEAAVDCGTDEKCEGGECKKKPVGPCVADEKKCEGGKVVACKADGSGWEAAKDCPSGEHCEQGMCKKDPGACTKENPCISCKELKDKHPTKSDGVYWIKQDDKIFPVYCDQTTKGGGWTLCLNSRWTQANIGVGKLYSNATKYDNITLLYPNSDPIQEYYDFCPTDKKEYRMTLNNFGPNNESFDTQYDFWIKNAALYKSETMSDNETFITRGIKAINPTTDTEWIILGGSKAPPSLPAPTAMIFYGLEYRKGPVDSFVRQRGHAHTCYPRGPSANWTHCMYLGSGCYQDGCKKTDPEQSPTSKYSAGHFTMTSGALLYKYGVDVTHETIDTKRTAVYLRENKKY